MFFFFVCVNNFPHTLLSALTDFLFFFCPFRRTSIAWKRLETSAQLILPSLNFEPCSQLKACSCTSSPFSAKHICQNLWIHVAFHNMVRFSIYLPHCSHKCRFFYLTLDSADLLVCSASVMHTYMLLGWSWHPPQVAGSRRRDRNPPTLEAPPAAASRFFSREEALLCVRGQCSSPSVFY